MEKNKVGEIQKNYNKQKNKMIQVGENTPYIEKMEEIQNREIENNKIKLHIERLKEEMETISDFEVKEEYQKQIVEAENNLQREEESLEKLEQEKETMVIDKKKEERDARKAIFDKVNELQDATRKEFMAEKKQIDIEIQKNQIEYEMLKLELSQFQYQYDENGIPTNGEEFRKMQEKQGDLIAQKKELEEMSQMCDTYRNELVAPYQMPAELPDDKIYVGYYKEIAKTEQDKILEEMVAGREKREQERYDETIKEAMEEEKRKEEQQKQDEQDEILEEMVAGREKREQERYNETIKEAMEEEKRKKEQQEQEEQEWQNEWNNKQKVKVMIAVSKNKIDIQGKEDELFYKEEMKHAKELKKEYNIKELFGKDKSAKKIDWALVSTLENIDPKGILTMDYLSVIKGESLNGKDLAASLEELNKKVDIEYVFDDKEIGLVNRKPKAFARKANELGIASLVGINEKSLFDRMKDSIADRFKNRKLFQKKDKVKQLDKSSAEKQKEQVINLINKDREVFKDRQKVNNEDNHIEENAVNKIIEEEQQMTAKEVETLNTDSVIDTDGEEIDL